MSLPFSRDFTASSVAKLPSDAYNKVQDFLATRYNGRVLVEDHFSGSAVDTGRWIVVGTPTVVSDTANGASGAVELDLASDNIATQEMALGTENFILYGRLKLSGTGANTSFQFGSEGALDFYVDASVSANWMVLINSVQTAPNGTPVAINSTYLDFYIERIGSNVVFTIGSTVLHTQTGYATSITAKQLRITGGDPGAAKAVVDYVTMFKT